MEGKSILTPPSTFVAHAHKSWGEGSSVEFYYPSCTPRLPLTTRTPAFPILWEHFLSLVYIEHKNSKEN